MALIDGVAAAGDDEGDDEDESARTECASVATPKRPRTTPLSPTFSQATSLHQEARRSEIGSPTAHAAESSASAAPVVAELGASAGEGGSADEQEARAATELAVKLDFENLE